MGSPLTQERSTVETELMLSCQQKEQLLINFPITQVPNKPAVRLKLL